MQSNPIRFKPFSEAIYVVGRHQDRVWDVRAQSDTDGHAEAVCLGLLIPIDDVTEEWIKDAKRLLEGLRGLVEADLMPREAFLSLLETAINKTAEARLIAPIDTPEFRKRGHAILAAHHVSHEGWGVWEKIGSGPPEWLELQAEIDASYQQVFEDTVREFVDDPVIIAAYEKGGWNDFEGSAGVDCYAERFFSKGKS